MAAPDIDPLGNGVNPISIEGGAQDWVLTCGVCHAGGGQLEYDRAGNDYSASSPTGDLYVFEYPSIAYPAGRLTTGFMSATNKAEVDCLLCHLDWSVDAAKNGNGVALLQTWGCGPTNLLGPLYDRDCSTAAAPNAPGISYDMYNRNFAVKNKRLDLAASMGIGAVGTGTGAGGTAPKVGDLTGINWGGVPGPINAAAVAGTPKSANCAPCHARDDQTISLPNMAGMKYGFGNYLLQFEAGDALDTDNGPTAANDKYWLDFGCKTGMGKRAHKIGVAGDSIGPNGVYSPIGMMVQMGYANAGEPIPNKMPDIDVHDRGGMACGTCHYALGSDQATYTVGSGGGELIVAAGEHHHVDYPQESVKSMDHNFAQGDSFPDTKGKNNLDGTVYCGMCHIDRTHPKVVSGELNPPTPTHAALPALHLDKIACATCHIPETYNSPGRLKYRDWTAGFYKGGFRNTLDFNFDMMTGSHAPAPVVRQWLTKFGQKQIYPVLPSVMPIWIEKVNSLGKDETGTPGSADPDGTAYPTGLLGTPIKARDAGLAAEIVRDNHPEFDIRLNGGNQIPLFDGFSMCDSWEIDTAAEINAMLTEGFAANPDNNTVALKLFQANFDVTHGIVPKEWALGGSARGGCVSCHSSHDPNNPNYSPNSVGFFEGHVTPLKDAAPLMAQMGIPTGMAVGGYDIIKNWFGLFADFDCTALCGAGALGDYDDPSTTGVVEGLFDPTTGAPVWGTQCGPMSPMHAMMGTTATIDMCVGMMTNMMDAAMGFPAGSAMNMGFYDGIAGLQGFTVKETTSGDLLGCNPMSNPAACMSHPDGNLLYSRMEARSHWKVDLQQSYMGGVKRVTWPVSGEKNPGNANHKNAWDQADYCLDYSNGNPFAPGMLPCNGSGPDGILGNADDVMPMSMDGQLHIANMIPANAYLGYGAGTLATLQQNQTSEYLQNLIARMTMAYSEDVSYEVAFNGTTSTCPSELTTPGVDTCTYTWNFGDGSAPVSGDKATMGTTSHTYPAVADTTYAATLTITDPTGGYTNTAQLNVTPHQVTPPAPADTAVGIAADGTITVTPGAGLSVNNVYIRWGDGQYTRSYTTFDVATDFTHAYASGTYSIYARVRDTSGVYVIQTQTVTIP